MADCAEDFAVVEEMLGEALALHQSGQLARAEALYTEILAACGEHAEVCYYLGLLCQADDRPDEALRHLEAACRLEPQQASLHLALGNLWLHQGNAAAAVNAFQQAATLAPEHGQAWYNLGAASFAAGALSEAIVAYEQAALLLPGDADTFYNLAIAYTKAERPADAIRAYASALGGAPADPDIHYNLALLYKRGHDHEAALRHLEEVVRIDARYAAAYSHLATMYVRLGRQGQAIGCYERLIELNHDVEAARHMLAALRGEQRNAVSAVYVRKLFDGYAETFEHELVEQLGYRSPLLLQQMVASLLPTGQRMGRVLDLGCGTGLAGEAFRPLATTMIGVDLSPKMVAIAEGKGVYDRLEVGEVVAYCHGCEARFDAIVAADVLVYLGELSEFFLAAAGRLTPGGWLVLSIEQHDGEGFSLRPTGRYAHAPSYIEELATRNGLTVRLREETPLRREQEEWLAGTLFVLEAVR